MLPDHELFPPQSKRWLDRDSFAQKVWQITKISLHGTSPRRSIQRKDHEEALIFCTSTLPLQTKPTEIRAKPTVALLDINNTRLKRMESPHTELEKSHFDGIKRMGQK